MKKLTFLLGLASTLCFGQEDKVAAHTYNAEIGFVGAWVNTEIGLSDQWAVRAEIGTLPKWYAGVGTGWFLDASLEPRYYYNIKRRAEQGKNTTANAANFLTVGISYRPEKSFGGQYTDYQSISIVPKWGIRRNLGDHFHYEVGAGFGFRHQFNDLNYGEIDLHLRIGYHF
ncbi:hypothetical protein [Riemerella columbina]|uniref:hypothetical protein n=1 Tax=Riemerella columbina TaxID=103810 RepID=UPI00266F6449|nr:hypothetical protein [Riemerella columbina]WKS95412.1 hypothetical protein NYR17_01340 [Riemerella columbina]